ncbi:MAG: hypothetical protein IPL52_01700 [Flavobacteriales bacterium]|nr:hypothetical protein [Flavobacteriales bacterium]
MTRRQIRKEAERLVKDGLGRQQVFDILKHQGAGMDDEKLARIVRYVPSLAARQRYKVPHAVLLVLLWITAVAKSLYGIGMAMESGRSVILAAFMLPIVTVILGIGIAMHRTRAYHTVAFLSVIGLVRYISRTDWANFDPFDTIDLVVAATMIGLAWYLFNKVASNYEVVPGADGTNVIVFPLNLR